MLLAYALTGSAVICAYVVLPYSENELSAL
jgi:hypothetical protein